MNPINAANSEQNFKVWLREKEITKMLGISRGTLWLWCKKKIFPGSFKIGQCTFWKKEDVDRFINRFAVGESVKINEDK